MEANMEFYNKAGQFICSFKCEPEIADLIGRGVLGKRDKSVLKFTDKNNVSYEVPFSSIGRYVTTVTL